MHRAGFTLALAMSLLACQSVARPADYVELVTMDAGEEIGCWLMPTYGELVADPEFGVAFKGTGAPAVWPSGYSGRRVGAEVEVLDRQQNVVTRTGIGLQMIYWGGRSSTGPGSGYICDAARAEEHLQPARGSPSPR